MKSTKSQLILYGTDWCGDCQSTPTILFPDGSSLTEPDDEELKEKLESLSRFE